MAEGILTERLFSLRDESYAAFQRKLIPAVPPDSVIGVRTPDLRALAREWAGKPEAAAFLRTLPHRYFDENQLHAFLLAEEKDFGKCMAGVEAFLPFVDNWATCDQLSPRVFRKHLPELLEHIRAWLASDHTYTVRFGLGMLMQHYLDGAFDPAYPALAAGVRPDGYYVNMMVAWYFATALAKQYDSVISYFERALLPEWVHQKAIQKAVESRRITEEHKEYLKSLRRKTAT